MEKLKKDKLWIIEVNTKQDNKDFIIADLTSANIGFVYQSVNGKCKMVNFKIYSYNQKQSQEVKKILSNYEVYYNIVESQKVL